MQSALLQTGLFVAEQILKYAPQLFLQFQALIGKKDVTIEEMQAERQRIAGLTYEQLVPHSQLPPS